MVALSSMCCVLGPDAPGDRSLDLGFDARRDPSSLGLESQQPFTEGLSGDRPDSENVVVSELVREPHTAASEGARTDSEESS